MFVSVHRLADDNVRSYCTCTSGTHTYTRIHAHSATHTFLPLFCVATVVSTPFMESKMSQYPSCSGSSTQVHTHIHMHTLMQIIGSLVNFLGEMQFINNTDDNAVAMHLLSFGQARLFSGLQMIFWGNNGT